VTAALSIMCATAMNVERQRRAAKFALPGFIIAYKRAPDHFCISAALDCD